MAKAIDVAKYLLVLAAKEEEPELITPLRLQKLLYYIQGWSLAQLGKPLFEEPIEAWDHGPVVRIVYREYKEYEKNPIPTPTKIAKDKLTNEEKNFIKDVWGGYKMFSATKLYSMTHNEAPWKQTKNHCVIQQDKIRAWFEDMEDKRDLKLAQQALNEPGPNVPFEEVCAELGIK